MKKGKEGDDDAIVGRWDEPIKRLFICVCIYKCV